MNIHVFLEWVRQHKGKTVKQVIQELQEKRVYKWWAYKHTSGTIQVRRYYFKSDLEAAYESIFVEEVTEVFEAETRADAIVIAKEKLKQTNRKEVVYT